MKSCKTSAYISFCALLVLFITSCKNEAIENSQAEESFSVRERILINQDWHFMKYGSMAEADHLIYDVRPKVEDSDDTRPESFGNYPADCR